MRWPFRSKALRILSAFWGRPASVRADTWAQLRANAPVSFQPAADFGSPPSTRGYWAVTTAALCAAILLVAAGIVYVIRSTEPKAQKGDVMRRSAALVEVVEVERGDHRPEIVVLGTVEASRDVELSPRVAGEIVAMAPSFVIAQKCRYVDIDGPLL